MPARQSLMLDLDAAILAGSGQKRAATLERVTDLFLMNVSAYTEDQIDLFDDVLLRFVRKISDNDNALIKLSSRLGPVSRSPVAVVRLLAIDDNIEIAGPVLSQSVRLTNSDLIKIACSKSQNHLLAISSRSFVEEPVTDVLVDRGDIIVLKELSRNLGASFSDVGFVRIADRSSDDIVLLESLASRSDVPREVLRSLLAQAPQATCSRLLMKVRPELRNEVVDVLSSLSQRIEAASNTSRAHAREIANSLSKSGGLNEATVRALVRSEKRNEICAVLELLTTLHYDHIGRIMDSGSSQAILTLCKASDFQWPTAWAILESRRNQHGTVEFRREQLRNEYARLTKQIAQRIVSFWKAREVHPAPPGNIITLTHFQGRERFHA